ncbi:hypothetical protein SAMN05216516_11331 [Izhakiella capsodis]|uniref:Uncharacterized protein n=1 Tax=Izhakiella capsodis TaxID=1367852 RepID=A0A1I5AUH2_9GAMM|nr:hypothetical protein [Izhakiella capsodis]SFN66075.1 hypothetical protein SAMN05216516_11331 [Izhakiella capsodis]
MTNINGIAVIHHLQSYSKSDQSDPNFNDKVLNYIEKYQPHCSLNDLLKQIKQLSPDKRSITLQKMINAFTYADINLREDGKYKNYTESTLDKFTSQLFDLNMLYNQMLSKDVDQSE